jgi:hypothetical protein
LQSSAQGGLVHEVVEQLLAVERNHRYSLQVAAQQLVVGLDVDLLEWVADALQRSARVVAQVAARPAVQDEGAQSPRSPLA